MITDPAVAAAVARTRSEVCDLHAALVGNNLVAWTSGNVSARVPGTGTSPGTGLLVIKPSGMPYAGAGRTNGAGSRLARAPS